MKRLVVFFLLIAVLALLAAGCGGGGGEATNGGAEGDGGVLGPVNKAEDASCAANRRVISDCAQKYGAMEGTYPTSIQQLVPDYLQSVPACPSGGVYSLQGGKVVCSVHGS